MRTFRYEHRSTNSLMSLKTQLYTSVPTVFEFVNHQFLVQTSITLVSALAWGPLDTLVAIFSPLAFLFVQSRVGEYSERIVLACLAASSERPGTDCLGDASAACV